MIVNGFLWTILAGALGGVLFEGLKLLDRWVKKDDTLGKRAVVWSAAMVVVGSLVPLIYGVKERNFLEVAQLGVAIPALITGGFKLSSSPDSVRAPHEGASSARTRSSGKGGGAIGGAPSRAKKPGVTRTRRSAAFLRYAGWRF